jgi:nucleotide-binding universal stress UspA family protein
MTSQAVVIPTAHSLTLKRILYATDFSEASLSALPVAAALAKRFDSTLCIAHVWSALTARMLDTRVAMAAYDQLQDAAQQRLAELMKDGRLCSLRCVACIAEGEPKDRLVPMMADEAIDLIVVGTQGKSGMKKLFLGSVAETISRTATCPVITVGPNVDKRFYQAEAIHNILCPVDLSGQSAAILPLASAVAAEFDSDVNLLHVLPASVAKKDIAGGITRQLKQQLQSLCRQHMCPRCDSGCFIEFGDAVETVLSFAEKNKIDLIALGVRPAMPAGLRFQDTVTYKIMTGARCPVLTYRSQWWT